MDTHFVVREKKNDIVLIRFTCLSGLILTYILYRNATPSPDNWLIFLVFTAAIFVFWIVSEVDYHMSKLELHGSEFIYRNAFGKIRKFNLEEICEVEQTVKYDCSIYCLIGQNDDLIVEFKKDAVNADKLIRYLEEQQKAGNWKGHIRKEYESIGKIRTNKTYNPPISGLQPENKTKEMTQNFTVPWKEYPGEILIVKPNKKLFSMLYSSIIGVIISVFVIMIGIINMIKGDTGGGIWLGAGLLVLLHSSISCMAWHENILPRYRNWCLTITPGECSFTNERGIKNKFQFDDIDDVKNLVVSGRSSREYFVISFKNGMDKIQVQLGSEMDNAIKLQHFISYHRNKEEESSV